MVIITDANGNIQTPTIPENVYQGSNLANEIVFLAPLPQTNVATITFKLPNGVLIEEQTMTPYNDVPGNYSGWKYVLNDVVTQYYGKVTFQIHLYGGAQAGETWQIKENPSYIQIAQSVDFEASYNNRYFNYFKMDKEDDKVYLQFGALIVYHEDTGWIDTRYRTIKFESSVPVVLQNWLMQNAVKNDAPPLVTTVAGTFTIQRGVPRLPHSTPSQDSWNEIVNWVADANEKIANCDAGLLLSKGILPYDSTFTYSLGASVFDKATSSIYTSKKNNNYNNALSNTTYWEKTTIEGLSQAEVQALIDASIATKQDALTETQLDAVNSGIDYTKVGQIAENTNDISAIDNKIPTQASAENQLADKDFVNSSIATNTANFIGTFENVEKLENVGYLVIYSVLKEDSVIAKGSVVNGTTYNHDTTLHSDLNITADSTLAFGSVIKSGSTIEIGSIINHEEYDSQTTTSDDITIDTITNNDYANVINQVIDFIDTTHMNNYDKTLLTNYDYAWIPNGTKYDLYRFDIVTQTWNSRATAIEKTDVSLITAYNRYKFNGTTGEWVWEYTINTSGFTAAQWAAINSGITVGYVAKIGSSALTTTAQDLSGAVNELNNTLGNVDTILQTINNGGGV